VNIPFVLGDSFLVEQAYWAFPLELAGLHLQDREVHLYPQEWGRFGDMGSGSQYCCRYPSWGHKVAIAEELLELPGVAKLSDACLLSPSHAGHVCVPVGLWPW